MALVAVRKHRADREIGDRLLQRRGDLLGGVSGKPDDAVGPDHAPNVRRGEIVLPDVHTVRRRDSTAMSARSLTISMAPAGARVVDHGRREIQKRAAAKVFARSCSSRAPPAR